jgi:hypothetical protein
MLAIATGQTNPLAVATDGVTVYWATDQPPMKGAILAANGATGSTTTIANRIAHPAGLAIDASYVYWTDSASVTRAPLGGGPAMTLASRLNGPKQIAVDARAVYWTSSGDGTVMKLAK